MDVETIQLEHVPDTHAVHVALFRDVQNAAFLHEQLLGRNAEFEYAFIDASVIVSRMQLLSAVFKAVHAVVNDALQTPNVHSETVASLSSSKNIAESYRRFGISPSTKTLLVVKVTFPTETRPQPPSRESIARHLSENVQGRPLPVTDGNIAAATDMGKVRKYYKLNGMPWLDALAGGAPSKTREVESLVLGAMALRGV